MAELFGTPLGQLARGAENRAELGFGLEALKTLGEIEAQPTEREYKRSLGALHAAEAELKGADASAALQMQGWAGAFRESAAREQLAQTAADQGRIATIADVPKGGAAAAAAKPRSQADMLERLANFIEDNGGSPLSTSKMRQTISGIKEEESRVMSREVRAAHNAFVEESAMRAQRGGVAGFMAASPQNFAIGMMDPATRALMPKELPPNFAAARPFLQLIEQTSMKAQEQAELELKKRDTAAREARAGAGAAASSANRDLAKARLGMVNAELDAFQKNGGTKSPGAKELRAARTQASQAYIQAQAEKNFPLAPLRKEDRVLGQTYTAANGQRFKWMLPEGASSGWGKPGPDAGVAVLLPSQPKAVAGRVPVSAGAAAAADDSDEDDDD